MPEVAAWEVGREPSLAGPGRCSPDTSLETLLSKADLNVVEKAPCCLPAHHPSEQSPSTAQPRAHPAPTNIARGSTLGRGAGGCSRSSPSTARHPADSCVLGEQTTILQFLGTVNELNSLVIHPRDLPNSKV